MKMKKETYKGIEFTIPTLKEGDIKEVKVEMLNEKLKESKENYEQSPQNKFIQHMPSFITGFEREQFEFNTLDELLNSEFVKGFKDVEGKEFYHYCLSGDKLMVEYDNGNEWYVLGTLSHIEGIDLPQRMY